MAQGAGTGRIWLVRALLVVALVGCGLLLWRFGVTIVSFAGCCALLWGWRTLSDRWLGPTPPSGVVHGDGPFADHSWIAGGGGRGDGEGDGGDVDLDADADLDADLGDVDVDLDFD